MNQIVTIIRNALNGILNVCWKAGVVVLACCAAYCVYNEFDEDINDFIHPWEYDHSLSPSIFVKYNAREECFRLYKWKTGGSVSRAKYKIVNAPDVGDLAVFKDMDNHFGYLNVNTGQEEIPAMYRDVFEFSEEGIAAVVRFEDDSLRFITTTGELAIDKAFVYDNTLAPKFYNGFCVICERTVQGRRYGLIDLNGSWVLKPEFTDMEICAGGELVYVVVEGENGETLEGRWNCKGYWEYQPVYKDIEFNNLDNSVFLTLNAGVRMMWSRMSFTPLPVISMISSVETLQYRALNVRSRLMHSSSIVPNAVLGLRHEWSMYFSLRVCTNSNSTSGNAFKCNMAVP